MDKFNVGDEIKSKKTGLCFIVTARNDEEDTYRYVPIHRYRFKNSDIGSINNSQRFIDENFELVRRCMFPSEGE